MSSKINLKSVFGMALGVFIFLTFNILLFGFSVPYGKTKPLINDGLFIMLSFAFVAFFMLYLLLIFRSKLSGKTSMIMMLFLVLLLTVSTVYASQSIKGFFSVKAKLIEDKSALIEEINLLESNIDSYKKYADSITNITNQYLKNNADLKLKLAELNKQKAAADIALKEKELEIQKEKQLLEELNQQNANQQKLNEQFYDDDSYYEDD